VNIVAHEFGHVYYAYSLDSTSWQAWGEWSREEPQSNAAAMAEGWSDFVRAATYIPRNTDALSDKENVVAPFAKSLIARFVISHPASQPFQVKRYWVETAAYERRSWQRGGQSEIIRCQLPSARNYSSDAAGWVAAAIDGTHMVVNNTTYFWNLYDNWVDSAVCDPLTGEWCDIIHLSFSSLLNVLPGVTLANVRRVSERLVSRYPQWQRQIGSVEVLSCTFLSPG
jgi:hypothetical protein